MTYQVKEQSFVTKPIKGVEWAEWVSIKQKKETQLRRQGLVVNAWVSIKRESCLVVWKRFFFLFFLSVDFFRVQVFFGVYSLAVVLSILQSRIVGDACCCLIARLDEWMNGWMTVRITYHDQCLSVVRLVPPIFILVESPVLFLHSGKVYRWLMMNSMDMMINDRMVVVLLLLFSFTCLL